MKPTRLVLLTPPAHSRLIPRRKPRPLLCVFVYAAAGFALAWLIK